MDETRQSQPGDAQLLAVIRTQTEIARLGLDLNGVMALVAERAQLITGATGAVVELADGDDMVYRAVAGVASRMLGLRLSRKNSLSGLCVELASTLRCEDSETDARVDREACRKVGLRSMIVVPLIHNGDAVGAMKVFSSVPAAFGEGEVQTLGLMSELIAAAMYHAARFGVDELFRQATRDSLTGLANRAQFLDRLRHGIVKAKRDGVRLGVLMIDMDGLKPINDQHGHRAGDAAIKKWRTGFSRRRASRIRWPALGVTNSRSSSPESKTARALLRWLSASQPIVISRLLLRVGRSRLAQASEWQSIPTTAKNPTRFSRRRTKQCMPQSGTRSAPGLIRQGTLIVDECPACPERVMPVNS